MTLRVTMVRAEPYALPLRAALPTPHGRTRHRRGWLLRIATDAATGWGDAAPWPGFGAGEARCDADLERLERTLPGALVEPERIDALLDDLRLGPEARHAAELALLDAVARARAVSLAELLFGRSFAFATTHRLVTDAVPTDATCVKVKVGAAPLEDDDRRLAAIRRSHPDAALRLDAGGRWSLAEAERALSLLSRHRISLVEQPVASLDDLARLRAHTEVALAVDEGMRTPDDLTAIAQAKADAVVLKPMFLGGVATARALARRAEALGLEAFVTNALESAVGRAGTLQLAAGLRGHHGLGSALAEDVARLPALAGDRAPLPPGSGHGVRPGRPDPSALPLPVVSAAAARPSHPALITEEVTLTYAELLRAVKARAASLAAQGIAPGDRVALGGPRDHAWVVSFHALGWLGAEVAPLPDRPGPERDRIVRAVGACFVIEEPPPDVPAPPPPERFWPLDEARVVICSSGSTGTPKAVALTGAQLAFSAFGSAIRLGLDPADRWLCCLPLHHVGGLSVLLRSAFYATTAILHPRFDLRAVSDAIDRDGVTLLSLVPEMLARLLDHRTRFPPTLRAILIGGAALDASLAARCRALGLPVAASWGMTEAASQLATAAPGDLDGGAPPLPFVRIDGESGRLVARGPLVRGRLVTGDRGRIEDDRVHVTGRADEAIISGGAKIDPRLVEAALLRHPAVREAVVIGVPSARWGARPVAFVVAAPGAPLADHCRRHLAPHEVPDRFVVLPALPRTALGKLDRGALVTLAAHDAPGDLGDLGDFGDEPETREAGGEPGRRIDGLEAVEGDDRVDVRDSRADDAVVAAEREGKGDRSPAEALHRHFDGERLAEAHGAAEIRLGVHERQAHPLRDQRLGAAHRGGEQLLEGCMAELENPAEEDDSRPIHFEEARRVAMNEGHDDDRR